MQVYARRLRPQPTRGRGSACCVAGSACNERGQRGRDPRPCRRRHAGLLALCRATRPAARPRPAPPGMNICCLDPDGAAGLSAERRRADHALLTGAAAGAEPAAAATGRCRRIAGYVGATGALGPLRGERFAGAGRARWTRCWTNLAAAGCSTSTRGPASLRRPACLEPRRRSGDRRTRRCATEIEAKLAALERIARDKGSALGLAGALRPVTVERHRGLGQRAGRRGLALAPVSAPWSQPPDASERQHANDAAR